MHIGMAEFVDSPTELWQSHSWAASIRTTSGQFAHYSSGETLLPSDFINHNCGEKDCKCGNSEYVHIGRVYEVGIDKRGKKPKIQEVLRHDELDKYNITADTLRKPIMNSIAMSQAKVDSTDHECQEKWMRKIRTMQPPSTVPDSGMSKPGRPC
jgi:hypothetical protein